ACGIRSAQNALQPLEAMERQGCLRPYDGGLGRRARRREDRDDRRDLPQGPPDSDQHGREKGGRGRLIGRTKGGMNTKLHAICDSQGRPLDLFVTAGQVSDYIGARALLGGLPKVEWLLGDRGYDADWFREALKDKGIRACIPGRKQRKTTVKYDKRRYKRRNRIEIMFGRLKDWRRVATRYDRCPKVFLSAIALAATVIYWL
ncbi:IS5 family transposase, partial [Thalassobius aquimarinus]|nr:IS5 family transposase [Thalassovita aquimarina]